MVRESWYQEYFRHSQVDDAIRPFLKATPYNNWLECARSASFLSRDQVAQRMGVALTTYKRFEKNEDSVSISNLRKCAEAMDCELIYVIRPKQQQTFGERIWAALVPHINSQAKTIDRALQLLVRIMYDPRFRRQQGWRKNKGYEAADVVKSLKEMRKFSSISSHPF